MDDTRARQPTGIGLAEAEEGDADGHPVKRREDAPPPGTVRREDLEPHEGLRYIARLFKVLSLFLILLLIGEIVIGVVQVGTTSIATLLVEATRLIVFAAFLWGAGDLALMLIESNHDLRASRILLGRLNDKMQRLTDIESDELELLAANPSLKRIRDGRHGAADPGPLPSDQRRPPARWDLEGEGSGPSRKFVSVRGDPPWPRSQVPVRVRDEPC